ncbi:MAG TPA: hypothetical protein VF631_00390 [Allosphingosinicella sp.]|jgi:hypothetical protein|uniref:hypothetical protein n=1 Tax=Allosphingosinicella sp. TaxID=2823234 RepID=UPI002F29C474
MFERLADRAERAGRKRAGALSAALAERVKDELPRGVQVEVTGDGLRLSGRGIGARFALEPGLRWLLARIR